MLFRSGSGHPGISLQLPLPHLAVSQIVWPPPAATSAHASPARTIAATAAGTLTGTGTIISPGPRGALRPVLVVYPAGLSKRCWLLAAATLARTQRFREPAGGWTQMCIYNICSSAACASSPPLGGRQLGIGVDRRRARRSELARPCLFLLPARRPKFYHLKAQTGLSASLAALGTFCSERKRRIGRSSL